MQVEMSAVWRAVMLHWVCLGLVACLVVTVWLSRRQVQIHLAGWRRERRVREEIEAYARLDSKLPADGDVRSLSRIVCRIAAEKSRFYRVAVLLRNADERLYVAGSAGMDEKTLRAVQLWGKSIDKDGEWRCGALEKRTMLEPRFFRWFWGRVLREQGLNGRF